MLDAASPGPRRYHYYIGTGLKDRFANRYWLGLSLENYAGWEDAPCTASLSTLFYMCEFAGGQLALQLASRPWLAAVPAGWGWGMGIGWPAAAAAAGH
jgi:hypothetical protein